MHHVLTYCICQYRTILPPLNSKTNTSILEQRQHSTQSTQYAVHQRTTPTKSLPQVGPWLREDVECPSSPALMPETPACHLLTGSQQAGSHGSGYSTHSAAANTRAWSRPLAASSDAPAPSAVQLQAQLTKSAEPRRLGPNLYTNSL